MAARQVPVTVYAEMTPNPEVMKFVANKVLNPGAPLDYSSSDDTAGSPLAEAVLNFPFVENVFISSNYVSVTKNDKIDWDMVVMETRNFISDYLRNDKAYIINDICSNYYYWICTKLWAWNPIKFLYSWYFCKIKDE